MAKYRIGTGAFRKLNPFKRRISLKGDSIIKRHNIPHIEPVGSLRYAYARLSQLKKQGKKAKIVKIKIDGHEMYAISVDG